MTNAHTMTDIARDRSRVHVTDTEFWNALMNDVYGPRQGGAIIFLDAQNARKGVAKTSGAVGWARLLARAFGYQLEKEDFLIAGPKYIRRYQEHPGKHQPSVLVADELVGGGAGDARRSMSNANINIGRAFQLLRKKRVVTIATLPDWNDADSRLQKLADYRLHCLEQPLGVMKAYKVTTPFNSGGSGPPVKTKGFGPGERTRRIKFPNVHGADDPYYAYLEGLKDDLLDEDDFDASALQAEDDEDEQMSEDAIRKQERIETAIRLYRPWDDEHAHSYEDVADTIPEFGEGWVGKIVRQWKRGEHRDLVPDPTANRSNASQQ